MSNPVKLGVDDSTLFPTLDFRGISVPWRYWKICRISLNSVGVGYDYYLVPSALEFVQKQITSSQNEDARSTLLSYFHPLNSNVEATIRAQAGLCLRCDVSYPLLKACKKIASLFGDTKSFTYRDLLPFVLNDDGQTPIILDSDGKTQLILDEQGKTQTTAFKFFSVEVLRKFNPHSQSSLSLENWAYLQTKQNPELKEFLSEFGFQHISDWALLNRARVKQVAGLSVRSRHLVEIFHVVYRRDRRQQQQKILKKCPDPSSAQLQEMLTCLQERGVVINNNAELLKELKHVATELRQYDIWSYREPLEIQDPNTGNYTPRPDLPTQSLSELDVEKQELLEFLHQQIRLALTRAIEEEINNCIAKLEKSKKYASLAPQFIPGLQLYYYQSMSLREIAPLLGMTSWDQARRVLNPGELVSKVRALTVQKLIDIILEKAIAMDLIKIKLEADYLKTLAAQIEAFADAEVFQEAIEEIRVGKNRAMNSLYAQQLRIYFENINLNPHEEHCHG